MRGILNPDGELYATVLGEEFVFRKIILAETERPPALADTMPAWLQDRIARTGSPF